MAEKKKGKGGRSGKQLRWLFASGILTSSGGGKGGGKRTVTYHKERAAKLNGAKATGKPGRKVPSKAARDKTRAERIEEGRWHAEDRLRSMIPGRQRERFNAASVMHAQSSPSAQRQGWSEIKGIAKGLSQKRKSAAEASRTRARRLTAVTNGRRTRAEKKRAAYNPLF